MGVRVEFYGLARARAETPAIDVEADNLGDALAAVAERLPLVGRSCFNEGRLQSHYLVNINGSRFTSDVTTPLQPGDSVMILSADVGG